MAFRQTQSDAGEAKSASDGDAGIDGREGANGHSRAAPDGAAGADAAGTRPSPVQAEQAYVTMLYALLDEARERSERALGEVRAQGAPGGTHQAPVPFQNLVFSGH